MAEDVVNLDLPPPTVLARRVVADALSVAVAVPPNEPAIPPGDGVAEMQVGVAPVTITGTAAVNMRVTFNIVNTGYATNTPLLIRTDDLGATATAIAEEAATQPVGWVQETNYLPGRARIWMANTVTEPLWPVDWLPATGRHAFEVTPTNNVGTTMEWRLVDTTAQWVVENGGAPRRWVLQPMTAEEKAQHAAEVARSMKRNKLRAQHQVAELVNHRGNWVRAQSPQANFSGASPQELVALQLLRQMVEPEQFRRYLKHGFITTVGPTGLEYQIGRTQNIQVRHKGVMLASLCIHLRGVPQTDEVVGKLLMAELDEMDLWAKSNVTWKRRIEEGSEVAAIVVKLNEHVQERQRADIAPNYGKLLREAVANRPEGPIEPFETWNARHVEARRQAITEGIALLQDRGLMPAPPARSQAEIEEDRRFLTELAGKTEEELQADYAQVTGAVAA